MRLLFALSIALTGCGLMAGLGDFGDQPVGSGGDASGGGPEGGGGATTTTGGNGGDGDGGGGTGAGGAGGAPFVCDDPAPDWTQSFDAVWTFDADPLGTDATGNNDLSANTQLAPPDTMEKVQGAASFDAPNGAGLVHTDPNALGLTSSFTFGAWLRLSAATSVGSTRVPLARFSSGNGNQLGYRMLLGGALRMNCHFNADAANSTASHLLDAGVWHHVVCRIDGELTIWFDGELDDTVNLTPTGGSPASTALQIPSSAQPFDGHIDEAFIIDEAISDAAIRRVRACGIDGARCCCRPGATTDYLDCGTADDCSTLSPCDEPTPQVKP